MREETQFEGQGQRELQWQLHLHKLRLRDWETLKDNFVPDGLTCPKCKADHCEIDGHSC
jgi:hypothetical protein